AQVELVGQAGGVCGGPDHDALDLPHVGQGHGVAVGVRGHDGGGQRVRGSRAGAVQADGGGRRRVALVPHQQAGGPAHDHDLVVGLQGQAVHAGATSDVGDLAGAAEGWIEVARTRVPRQRVNVDTVDLGEAGDHDLAVRLHHDGVSLAD